MQQPSQPSQQPPAQKKRLLGGLFGKKSKQQQGDAAPPPPPGQQAQGSQGAPAAAGAQQPPGASPLRGRQGRKSAAPVTPKRDSRRTPERRPAPTSPPPARGALRPPHAPVMRPTDTHAAVFWSVMPLFPRMTKSDRVNMKLRQDARVLDYRGAMEDQGGPGLDRKYRLGKSLRRNTPAEPQGEGVESGGGMLGLVKDIVWDAVDRVMTSMVALRLNVDVAAEANTGPFEYELLAEARARLTTTQVGNRGWLRLGCIPCFATELRAGGTFRCSPGNDHRRINLSH